MIFHENILNEDGQKLKTIIDPLPHYLSEKITIYIANLHRFSGNSNTLLLSYVALVVVDLILDTY